MEIVNVYLQLWNLLKFSSWVWEKKVFFWNRENKKTLEKEKLLKFKVFPRISLMDSKIEDQETKSDLAEQIYKNLENNDIKNDFFSQNQIRNFFFY